MEYSIQYIPVSNIKLVNLPAPYRLAEYQTKLQETTSKTSHVTEEHVQQLEVRVLRMMFNALLSLSLSLSLSLIKVQTSSRQ